LAGTAAKATGGCAFGRRKVLSDRDDARPPADATVGVDTAQSATATAVFSACLDVLIWYPLLCATGKLKACPCMEISETFKTRETGSQFLLGCKKTLCFGQLEFVHQARRV
jgi:hypothetical protein